MASRKTAPLCCPACGCDREWRRVTRGKEKDPAQLSPAPEEKTAGVKPKDSGAPEKGGFFSELFGGLIEEILEHIGCAPVFLIFLVLLLPCLLIGMIGSHTSVRYRCGKCGFEETYSRD